MSSAPCSRAKFAQQFEKTRLREVQPGVGRHRLQDDGRNRRALRAESRAHGGVVVEGQRDGHFRERARHAGAVRLAVGQRAAAGFDQQRIDVPVVAAGELDDPIPRR